MSVNAEKTSDPKSLETEIVIVGGGGAGLAVGSDTGGWESGSYCGILSRMTFGFAINSGRIAGENGANHVAGK